MKKTLCLAFACIFCFALSAQNNISEQDTLSPISTTWEMMPKSVRIVQSEDIMRGFEKYCLNNSQKMYPGYRIRIYFNSEKNAREEANATIGKFRKMFPDTPYYLEFERPNYKVTVGDYGSKLSADMALKEIKAKFKTAIIVKQKYRFPPERK